MVRFSFRKAVAMGLGIAGASLSVAQHNPLGVPLEFTIWGGVSTFDGGGLPRESKSGIRFAQITLIPNPNWRYWAKYDNTLTLDNFTFARGGDTAEAYFLGGQYHVEGKYQMLLEAGIRHLAGDVDQTIIKGEYVKFMPGERLWKLGGWVGPREDDHTEWLGYFGYGFPVSNNFRLEPTFFYSRSGFGDENQWRILIGGDYMMANNLKVNAGIAFGRQNGFSGNNDFVGGHVILEIPISMYNKAYFLVRREQSGDQNLWNAAVGITISIR